MKNRWYSKVIHIIYFILNAYQQYCTCVIKEIRDDR